MPLSNIERNLVSEARLKGFNIKSSLQSWLYKTIKTSPVGLKIKYPDITEFGLAYSDKNDQTHFYIKTNLQAVGLHKELGNLHISDGFVSLQVPFSCLEDGFKLFRRINKKLPDIGHKCLEQIAKRLDLPKSCIRVNMKTPSFFNEVTVAVYLDVNPEVQENNYFWRGFILDVYDRHTVVYKVYYGDKQREQDAINILKNIKAKVY